MNVPAQKQAIMENLFDLKLHLRGGDLCDIIGPVLVEAGASGDSVTLGVVATNIECQIREISGANAQTVIGGESFTSSHQIEMKRNAATLAITPGCKLRVHPRNDTPERVFEKPVMPVGTFTPLLLVKAILVRQGYE